ERLRVDGRSRGPRRLDGLDSLPGGRVHEVDASTGGSSQPDRPAKRQLLRELRVNQVHVRPVQPALGAKPLVGGLPELVVLGRGPLPSAGPTLSPPCGATRRIASSIRRKASRNGGRWGCGGSTSVVNTLKLGTPASIASRISSKAWSGNAPQRVM